MASLGVAELLQGTKLLRLSRQLAGEDFAEWESMDRLSLLKHLKEKGVDRLLERQAAE